MDEKKKKSKIDPDLKKKIKEIEDKVREEAMKNAPVSLTKSDGEEGMSFDQWWMVISKKLSLKPWLKEIVWVDFKARGLKAKEAEQKYDDAMKLFGYKC